MRLSEFIQAVAFGMFVGFVFTTCLLASAQGTGWSYFDADRACRPGMMVETLTGNRALCVGGGGETWVVEVTK